MRLLRIVCLRRGPTARGNIRTAKMHHGIGAFQRGNVYAGGRGCPADFIRARHSAWSRTRRATVGRRRERIGERVSDEARRPRNDDSYIESLPARFLAGDESGSTLRPEESRTKHDRI